MEGRRGHCPGTRQTAQPLPSLLLVMLLTVCWVTAAVCMQAGDPQLKPLKQSSAISVDSPDEDVAMVRADAALGAGSDTAAQKAAVENLQQLVEELWQLQHLLYDVFGGEDARDYDYVSELEAEQADQGAGGFGKAMYLVVEGQEEEFPAEDPLQPAAEEQWEQQFEEEELQGEEMLSNRRQVNTLRRLLRG